MKLDEATLDFWNIGLAFRKRKEASEISTGTAISVLNTHLVRTDVTMRLRHRMLDLSFGIIRGNIQRHG